MSFINELKRRNVIRVAIAYVVVAWLAAQVTGLALESFAAPDWVMKTVLLLLVIGFPLAVILAWAYELTPEGVKKEKDVDRSESITHVTGRKLDFIIIVVLVLALGYFGYDEFVIEPAQEEALATDSVKELVTTEIQRSIAVLPFVNMSSDPEQEYFSDGLSEEILNLLAKIPELKVIGRTSSFAFKNKNDDLRIIGQALGVDTLLEGSVRTSGNKVRITAQLIDTSDASHIWSETYDRTLTDIFAVQDDVAAAIIGALQIHVGAKPSRGRPTENTEAYALFLKARASMNVIQFYNAEKLLLEAIELDPEFAEAYEMLAYAYWWMAGDNVNAAYGQKLVGEAAVKALALNPDLVFAQALYHSGNVESYSYLQEIEAFERAVRQQPGNSALLDTLIFDLSEAGYLQEALGVAERFIELDPLSPAANFNLAYSLYAVGRTSEAMPPLELAHQLGYEFANYFIGEVNLAAGRDDIAIGHYENFLEQNGLSSDWVRELVTGARDPETGQALLDRRVPEIVASMPEEKAYSWRSNLTLWYRQFGFLERHFELIQDLDLTDSMWTDADVFVWSGTLFRRQGFTAHPKYVEVAEAIGIIDVWEHRGPPDFCSKSSGRWVCE